MVNNLVYKFFLNGEILTFNGFARTKTGQSTVAAPVQLTSSHFNKPFKQPIFSSEADRLCPSHPTTSRGALCAG